MRRSGEQGYALVTAVVAMAVLGLFSLTLLQSARGALAGASATAERARLEAAAEAGLVLAVQGLAATDQANRWGIDGRVRRVPFAGLELAIRVEDESGKIPLNQITEEQARAMFEAFGLDTAAVERLTDAFLDWRDDDDDVRPDGAEAPTYQARGIIPRNGALRAVDELYDIKGFTPAIVEKLRPAVSVYIDNRSGFDDRYAHPLALAVMSGGGVDAPAVLQRQRELDGQRVAIDLADRESLVGRPLLIRVAVRGPGEARHSRATVVQLTGVRRQPYIVRQYD